MDFREFIRFAYHENIIPTFLSADEMVYVFQKQMSESQENAKGKVDRKSVLDAKSAMIDYTNFLKSFIRMAAIAQEKIGGGADEDEDLLSEKLEQEYNRKVQQRRARASGNSKQRQGTFKELEVNTALLDKEDAFFKTWMAEQQSGKP